MQSTDRTRHTRIWKALAVILPALLLLALWLHPSPVARDAVKLSQLERAK